MPTIMRNPFPNFILLAYIITVLSLYHIILGLLCAKVISVLELYSELVILVTNFNAHCLISNTSSCLKSFMSSRQRSYYFEEYHVHLQLHLCYK